jgi:hypothetical protein
MRIEDGEEPSPLRNGAAKFGRRRIEDAEGPSPLRNGAATFGRRED